MSVESDKVVFSNYYSDLLEHPEQAMQRTETHRIVKDTFEALGSLNKLEHKQIEISGRRIDIDELGENEIDIFEKFVEKFSNQKGISEDEAISMKEGINAALEGLRGKQESISNTKNPMLSHLILNLDKAKIQLSSVEAENRLTKISNDEQQKVKDLEKDIKREKIIFRLKLAAAVGALVVTFAGLGVVLFFVPPLIILIPALFIIFGIGMGGIWGGLATIAKGPNKKPQEDSDEAKDKIAQVEKYKNLVKEPGFKDFIAIPENNYQELSKKEDTFLKFIQLYEMEKFYYQQLAKSKEDVEIAKQKEQLESDVLKKANLLLPIKGIIESESQSRAEIDKLREDLELLPLPIPAVPWKILRFEEEIGEK